MVLLLRLLTHGWRRVMWLSLWLIWSRKRAFRHGGKESVASAEQSGCQGFAIAAIFPDCQPGASLDGSAPGYMVARRLFSLAGASVLSGTSIGGQHYGSNPQALQVTQVMTDGSRREIEVGRLRIQFFVKRRIEQTPTQPLANAFAPVQVSTPEATAFDLVRYASRIGGIGRAVETLTPLLPLMGHRTEPDAEN